MKKRVDGAWGAASALGLVDSLIAAGQDAPEGGTAEANGKTIIHVEFFVSDDMVDCTVYESVELSPAQEWDVRRAIGRYIESDLRDAFPNAEIEWKHDAVTGSTPGSYAHCSDGTMRNWEAEDAVAKSFEEYCSQCDPDTGLLVSE